MKHKRRRHHKHHKKRVKKDYKGLKEKEEKEKKKNKYIVPTILAIIIIYSLMRWGNDETLDKFETKLSEIKQNITSDMKEIGNEIEESVSIIKEDLDPKSYKNIQKAFEELNELRTEQGISKLKWDGNIYELVKFQASKELCSVSHCDHMDSSGKYFDAYAARFGVSLLGHSAENIAGSDCHQAITDLWLYSTTGHKENMLNPVMNKGALAYDKGNCVLIVTS